ncbi:MAG: DUF3137 domain-containing protein [Rhodospirillales bacterium]|nr:DUF3137 domain-containing protein [Rhodospirillales bacterium]
MTESSLTKATTQDLRDLAISVESVRKAYMLWLVIGIGLLSFCMTFILLYIGAENIDLKYTVTFGALLPSLALYGILNRAYLVKGKARLANGVCSILGFRYREDGCLSVSNAERHKILPPHNKSRLREGMQGRHNGVSVDIQEVMLSELRQDPAHKNRQKEYLRFWGLLVRVNLTRSLSGHTVAIPHRLMDTFFRAYYSNYHPIKLPESKFTKLYEVRGSDSVDAKMILSGTLRDQILASAKSMDAYWNEVSFRGNEILFVYQRFLPLFDIDPLWKPVTEKNLRQSLDDLYGLGAVIDAIRGNPQISI